MSSFGLHIKRGAWYDAARGCRNSLEEAELWAEARAENESEDTEIYITTEDATESITSNPDDIEPYTVATIRGKKSK